MTNRKNIHIIFASLFMLLSINSYAKRIIDDGYGISKKWLM